MLCAGYLGAKLTISICSSAHNAKICDTGWVQEEEVKARAELERSQAEKKERLSEEVSLQDLHLSISEEARQLAQRRAIDKKEELCKLSSALAVLASASVHHLHTLKFAQFLCLIVF